ADVSLPGAVAPRASEIELKLVVDADCLGDFNDAPIVATKARNKGTRKHLKSVYYDTSERTLWRNGLSLRVPQTAARFAAPPPVGARSDAVGGIFEQARITAIGSKMVGAKRFCRT